MKRLISLVLLICIALTFCACQENTNNINIEDFSKKHGVMYKESKYVAYYCEFENGILEVSKNTYRDSASSPSGVILDDSEITTYTYSLDGDNYITVNGEKYYYRAYQVAEYESYVEFSVPFLGIAKKWAG